MARRYFTNPLPPLGPTILSKSLGHHLGRVVRTNPGDAVVLFDGNGAEVAATVIEVRGRDVVVEVFARNAQLLGRSPRMALDIACALPKNPRAEWLFEHGTEAGIRSFRPILTERTNRQHEQRKRWERILIEACAQCDRSILPTIEPTVTLTELCAMPHPAARFLATRADLELGAAETDTAILVVGPEGGLSDREIHLLTAAGFAPRSLGPLTLRTETAVLAGATRLLQAPQGNLRS
ncbi:MAG: 16S rRNA (uracil(1498)-N(3))-methyltransferase [Planctomycetes bacterium]|jgi:16S rRNA (uracil1498-N3)-methyltransferase|nr:16S rRNA (uracil(1498)-N(3))-methyltransferase [Planctomycetota bacterium]